MHFSPVLFHSTYRRVILFWYFFFNINTKVSMCVIYKFFSFLLFFLFPFLASDSIPWYREMHELGSILRTSDWFETCFWRGPTLEMLGAKPHYSLSTHWQYLCSIYAHGFRRAARHIPLKSQLTDCMWLRLTANLRVGCNLLFACHSPPVYFRFSNWFSYFQ